MGNFKQLPDLDKLPTDKARFAVIKKWLSDTLAFQTTIILTDGANIDWDPTKNYNAKVTLGGNRTLRFPALPVGSYGTLEIIQDGSGSRTLTLPAQYTNKVANAGAGAITLSAGAADIDVATFYYNGSYLLWTVSLDFT